MSEKERKARLAEKMAVNRDFNGKPLKHKPMRFEVRRVMVNKRRTQQFDVTLRPSWIHGQR